MSGIVIRFAARADVAAILRLIHELAAYEKLLDRVQVSEADLLRDGFGEWPRFECLIAERDGAAVGLALYYYTYSTFAGRPGLYLEDLIVGEAARGLGIGRRLVAQLAQVALERGCQRVDFTVLPWNPARDFYARLGATRKDEWLGYSLSGAALRRLAGDAG